MFEDSYDDICVEEIYDDYDIDPYDFISAEFRPANKFTDEEWDEYRDLYEHLCS